MSYKKEEPDAKGGAMALGLKRRFALAGAVVAVAAPVGAGTAAACNGGHANGSTAVRTHERRAGLLTTAAGYLGVTKDALKTQLESGMSLAQIADATSGKSSAGLVDALVAPVKTTLDSRVSAGKITAAQETTMLTGITTKLQSLVAVTWPTATASTTREQHGLNRHGGHGRHHHHH
jgi:hypothetical protein